MTAVMQILRDEAGGAEIDESPMSAKRPTSQSVPTNFKAALKRWKITAHSCLDSSSELQKCLMMYQAVFWAEYVHREELQ